MYEQLRQQLVRDYPNLRPRMEYAKPGGKQAIFVQLCKVATVLGLLLFIASLTGYLPKGMMAFQVPAMLVAAAGFLGMQHGGATGAFELVLNGKVIFSKLETGRMPKYTEVQKALDQ